MQSARTFVTLAGASGIRQGPDPLDMPFRDFSEDEDAEEALGDGEL